jgi:hypothetical protein
MDRAIAAANEADLVIAMGSTLSVYPAASIPLMAASRGVPYVIVWRSSRPPLRRRLRAPPPEALWHSRPGLVDSRATVCNTYLYYKPAMPLTVRLNPKTERALNALAKRRRLSRSDIVREAIAQYGASDDARGGGRPYDAWLDVIGTVSLGAREPARTTGHQFTDIVRRQARRRHAR